MVFNAFVTACSLPRFDCHSSDPDFFKKIVTGDETWCFAYDPTTKRQSAAWVGEISPRPKKIAISEVSCEDHVGDFLRLERRNPQRVCSGR